MKKLKNEVIFFLIKGMILTSCCFSFLPAMEKSKEEKVPLSVSALEEVFYEQKDPVRKQQLIKLITLILKNENSAEVQKMLNDFPDDTRVVNSEGWNLLHYAAYSNNSDLAWHLLPYYKAHKSEFGWRSLNNMFIYPPDPFKENAEGKSAFDTAQERKNNGVIRALKCYLHPDDRSDDDVSGPCDWVDDIDD